MIHKIKINPFSAVINLWFYIFVHFQSLVSYFVHFQSLVLYFVISSGGKSLVSYILFLIFGFIHCSFSAFVNLWFHIMFISNV